MTKFKLLMSALFIVFSVLCINVTNAEVLIIHDTGANISYTLNSGFPTERTFTGVGTISITNGEDTITILDRNLGAENSIDICKINFSDICSPGYEALGTSTQDECVEYCENQGIDGSICTQNLNGYTDASACMEAIDAAYNDKRLSAQECKKQNVGYYFQWGNNYGFQNTGFETGNQQVPCGGYLPSTYSSSTFVVGFEDWCSTTNNNLWGGLNDTAENHYGLDLNNPEARQGPCPDGYHVPSQGEWYALYLAWYTAVGSGMGIYGGSQRFVNDFLISRDYVIYSYNGSFLEEGWNQLGYYLTSSPYIDSSVLHILFYDGQIKFREYGAKADGQSLRCFKDPDLSYGGEPQVIVNIADFNSGQNTCSGSNFLFENIVAGTSTGTYTRSGVFECAFGNGRSSPIVTLQLSGNLVASGDRVISGSNLEMINSEWAVTPGGLKFAQTLSETYKALTTTQELFHKSADLIGVASGVVTIKLTVPGGTPDGTYNGTLVLTY